MQIKSCYGLDWSIAGKSNQYVYIKLWSLVPICSAETDIEASHLQQHLRATSKETSQLAIIFY